MHKNEHSKAIWSNRFTLFRTFLFYENFIDEESQPPIRKMLTFVKKDEMSQIAENFIRSVESAQLVDIVFTLLKNSIVEREKYDRLLDTLAVHY